MDYNSELFTRIVSFHCFLIYYYPQLDYVTLLFLFQYILSRLSQLDCSRWNVTEHSFEQDTVLGRKPFTNIIATLDPHVDKRLALVAHYDSKILSEGTFLGATDSALPVALLLDMALALDSKLKDRQVPHGMGLCPLISTP